MVAKKTAGCDIIPTSMQRFSQRPACAEIRAVIDDAPHGADRSMKLAWVIGVIV